MGQDLTRPGKNPPDSRSPGAHKEVGINAVRSCTDWCCLIVMIIFFIGLFIVAGIAFSNGNPDRLIYGSDLTNSVCGKGSSPKVSYDGNKDTTLSDWSDRKYLWYPVSYNFLKLELIVLDAIPLAFCVTECPRKGTSAIPVVKSYGQPNSDPPTYPILFDSQPKFGRCIPDFLTFDCSGTDSCTSAAASGNETFAGAARSVSTMTQGLQEIRDRWWVILVCTIIAILLSFGWLLILRYIIKPVIIITMILLLVALIGVGILFFVNRTNQSQPGFYLAIAIVCWIAAFVFFCAAIFLWRDVMTAVDIMEEATRIPTDIPTMTVVPPIAFCATIPFLIFAIIVAIYIQTSGEDVTISSPLPSNYFPSGSTQTFENGASITDNTDKSLNTTDINFVSWRAPAHIFNLFMFLWTFGFFNAIGFLTLALCGVFWYWSVPGDKKEPPTGSVLIGAGMTFKHHLGSLALGSFIVAVIQTLRIVMQFIEARLKQSGQQSDASKCMFKCIHCFLAYMERVIKFINKNAYVAIALRGDNFVNGARRAVSLLLQNALAVTALSIISEYVLIFGKLLVTCLVTVIGYFIMDAVAGGDDDAASSSAMYVTNSNATTGTIDAIKNKVTLGLVLVLLVIALLAYIISSLFVNVLGVSIDVMLLSFCYDKAEPGFDYYPDDLAQHVEKAYMGKDGKQLDPDQRNPDQKQDPLLNAEPDL